MRETEIDIHPWQQVTRKICFEYPGKLWPVNGLSNLLYWELPDVIPALRLCLKVSLQAKLRVMSRISTVNAY